VIMFSSMQVPWNRLGKDPVIVLLDRIYILAEPLQDDRTFTVSTGICIL
jgi:vacuolar protein sorting-associated protein 13A/C